MTCLAVIAVLAAQPLSPNVESSRKMPHCGVAVVYGVSKLLGVPADPETIEKSIVEAYPGVDLSALSLTQLSEAFARLGLQAIPKQCEPADAVYLKTPFVAYYLPRRIQGSLGRAGHVVIVTFISRNGVRVLDLTESSEPIELTFSDFRDSWDGHFLDVLSDDDSRKAGFGVRIGWLVVAIGSLSAFVYSLKIGRRINVGLQPPSGIGGDTKPEGRDH